MTGVVAVVRLAPSLSTVVVLCSSIVTRACATFIVVYFGAVTSRVLTASMPVAMHAFVRVIIRHRGPRCETGLGANYTKNEA